MKTSISHDLKYVDICQQAVENDNIFNNFKNIPRYTDVLEHVEPDKLMFVLDDIRNCAKQVVLFAIATRPSTKTFPDGRNTHLIIENAQWWKEKLEIFFSIGNDRSDGHIFIVTTTPKKIIIKYA